MTFPKQTVTQSRRLESGLSLLEVGMALALAAVVIAGLTMYASNASEKMKRRGDAQHLLVFAQAGEAYVTKNQGSLLSGGALDPALHPLGTVLEVSGAELQNDGDLSKSVSDAFGDGQTLELMIQAVPNPSPPPTGSQYLLKGMVVSYNGTAFSDQQVGEIVSLAGAAGGFASRTLDVTHIDGAGGAWQEPLSDWTHAIHRPSVGHVAALVGMSYGASSSTDGPWLARRIIDGGAAPYEHNTMRTDINMSDTFSNPPALTHHSLLGADRVQASEYVGQTAGGDINIGSITATPNINVGSTNSDSINFRQGNVELLLSSSEFKTDNSFGEGFYMSSGKSVAKDGTSSYWAAEEPRIQARQDDVKGSWVDVFDSKPNGELDINTPTSTKPGTLALNALGENAQVKISAPDSTGAVDFYVGDQSTYSNAPSPGSVQVHMEKQFKVYDPSNTVGFLMDVPSYTYSTNAYTYLFKTPKPKGGGDWQTGMQLTEYNVGQDVSWNGEPVLYVGGTASGQEGNGGDIQVWGYIDDKDSSVGHVSSDRRLKKDIVPLTDALHQIEKLNGYSFKWKRDDSPDIGVIAQEVEKVFPSLVDVSRMTGMKEVSYQKLVAPLIEAVKTLHHMLNDAIATFSQQIAALQKDDHTLQTQVQTLTQQNAALQAELAQQQLDMIKLKFAIHQPLTAAERTLCGTACTP